MNLFKYTPDIEIMLQIISNYDDLNNLNGVIGELFDEEITVKYIETLKVLNIIEQLSDQELRLTNEGWVVALADKSRQKYILRDIIFNNNTVKGIVAQSTTFNGGFDVNAFFNIVSDYATIKTILSWLIYYRLIIDNGDTYEYNHSYVEDIQEDYIQNSAPQSIYPLNYSIEIDIKEERFSVFEYLRKIDKDIIEMNPDFQRNLVWKLHQKSQFIESIILNVPIPPIYLKRENNGRLIVVDGLQRTKTLMQFYNNEFKLAGLEALSNLNGLSFSDFERSEDQALNALSTRIEDKQLLFYILQPTVQMQFVYDLFNRINTGGTKLERQEIRNCVYIGNSTRLLETISKDKGYRQATHDGISSKRMKDREAALRCLAFVLMDVNKDYDDSMDNFLERAMMKINQLDEVEVNNLRKRFIETMQISLEIFGDENFRIPTEISKGRVNIAIMETIYHYLYHNNVDHKDYHIIKERYSKLIKNTHYLEAVRQATGFKKRVLKRFEIANNILSGKE